MSRIVQNGCCHPRTRPWGYEGKIMCLGCYCDACDGCQALVQPAPGGSVVASRVGVLVVDASPDDLPAVILGVAAHGARTLVTALRGVAPKAVAEMPILDMVSRHRPEPRLVPAIRATGRDVHALEVAHLTAFNESEHRQGPAAWCVNEHIVAVPASVVRSTLADGSVLLRHDGAFPGRVMHYNSVLCVFK
jgi:hypothetical protein